MKGINTYSFLGKGFSEKALIDWVFNESSILCIQFFVKIKITLRVEELNLYDSFRHDTLDLGYFVIIYMEL